MSKKYKVVMAESKQTEFFKPLLEELYRIFKKKELFVSDEVSLVMSFYSEGSYFFTKKEKEHIKKTVEEAFGVKLSNKQLRDPYRIFLPWLNKNRTIMDTSKYKIKPFLGILSIEDEEKGRWHFSYFYSNKASLDYWIGLTMGKTSESGMKLTETLNEEISLFKKIVYDIRPDHHWVISTVEGDKILCNNIYEVCCWLDARASNYSGTNKKEDW